MTAGGIRIEADNVVVATGTFGRTPRVPAFADRLDPSIRQLHSSEYRRPSQLADGAVLVVGASHSGCDIAYDAAATHPTVLCGPDAGEIPVPFSSPLAKVVFTGIMFSCTHVLQRGPTRWGARPWAEFRTTAALPRLRVRSTDLAERGVDWVPGRVTGVRRRPAGDRRGARGGRLDRGVVHRVPAGLPAGSTCRSFGEDGWPVEYRGAVDAAPGLFFCGLCFQYAAASMTIHGVGRDAAHVAGLIARRQAGASRRTVERGRLTAHDRARTPRLHHEAPGARDERRRARVPSERGSGAPWTWSKQLVRRPPGLRGARVGHGVPAPVRPRPRRARGRGLPRARHGGLPGRRPRGGRPGAAGVVPPPRRGRRHPGRRARHLLARAPPHHHRQRRRSGSGWVARGARLLQDAAPDAVEHGYLAVHRDVPAHLRRGVRRRPRARRCGVAETGRRCRDANLVAVGLSSQGRLLIYLGQVREGLALLDEAMVGLADPDVSPILAGHSYCSMVEACQEIADYRRMAEWTTPSTRWCRMQPELVPFTGQCAVHRAQIMRSQGALPEALEELALALTRYAAEGSTPAAGLALYERGEVLRMQGDLAGAAAAFRGGRALGRDPQPGQSLLTLAKGHGAGRVGDRAPPPGGDAGRGAPHRACCPRRSRCSSPWATWMPPGRRPTSSRGWRACFGCRGAGGGGGYAVGSVRLRAGGAADAGATAAAADALPHLRHAWKLWIDLGARYEAAWARVRIGLACRALGDEDVGAVRAGGGGAHLRRDRCGAGPGGGRAAAGARPARRADGPGGRGAPARGERSEQPPDRAATCSSARRRCSGT